MDQILSAYNISPDSSIQHFGTGLINNTWLVTNATQKFILQKINHAVFTRPENIAFNIRNIADFIQANKIDYLFITPIKNSIGAEMTYLPDMGYFRLFPFLENSHTISTVNNPCQAYEAALQFGKFTKVLQDFPSQKLRITIADFHNLSLRYNQFLSALVHGNKIRIKEVGDLTKFITDQKYLVDKYEAIKHSSRFMLRVTHHDTKISNVLFDAKDKGLAVIDLDTTMPGYFISDFGDMMRTYLSPANEEEQNFDKIEIRKEYFKALSDGYLENMSDILTEDEKNNFIYAGECLIYMQALRFLTDYLNDDIYYETKYEAHNLVRAKNQIDLLKKLKILS